MIMTEEMTKMLEVIKTRDDALRKHDDTYKRYFAPDIPEKIIKNLIKNFDNHLPVNSLVAYYDTTLLSMCRGGFVFTNDGLYYKHIGKAIYFRYVDITYAYSLGNDKMYLKLETAEMSEYSVINILDMNVMQDIVNKLIDIDKIYGQSSQKITGKIKKIDIPSDKMEKCNGIIHGASVACGGVGTGLAQIPTSDNAIIVPIQIGMIVALGAVFELNITESTAKSIIASAGASIAGRTVSQVLVGWIPGIGNAINTATAAAITEAIGWIAVNNFYERWIEDKNKGRLDGMKDGYNEASEAYEAKLRAQAEAFLNQVKDAKRERDEYENLLHEYEEYIKDLEKKCAASEAINRNKEVYKDLMELRSA